MVINCSVIACIAVLFSAPAQLPTAANGNLPSAGVQAQRDAASNEALRTTYRLGPDDQIMIQVTDLPDINAKPQRLDPNGDLKLPMVGRVHASGMTLEQLEGELTTRLKVYMLDPDVAVSVTEFHSQPVSVIGAISNAGVRQLEGRKSLIEVLSLAGGVSPDAGPIVRITRRLEEGRIPMANAVDDASGRFSTAEIDLKPLLEGRSPEKNIVIQPHDVISVPRAEMVFVIGEVGKPGPVPLSGETSVSVIEAVSSSGGVLRTAAASHARILRRIEGGQKRTELMVDLKNIMQGKADDVPLVAGDILIVPDSRGKRATARAFEAAMQAGVIAATYGLAR